MSALTEFDDGVAVVQSLWNGQQQARADYARRRRRFRQTGQEIDRQLADEQYAMHHALVQAAAVRLTTCWEVFLLNLLQEYLFRRPGALKRRFQLRGGAIRTTEATLETIVEDARRPFQELSRAKELLRKYLGEDLFARRNGNNWTTVVNTDPVERLISVRNAIVHKGGAPTRQFRSQLKTSKSAQAYLLERPGPTSSLLASRFEQLLTEVVSVTHALYGRTWQRPRP
jgi:hypothetical protein